MILVSCGLNLVSAISPKTLISYKQKWESRRFGRSIILEQAEHTTHICALYAFPIGG